jgi:glycosyltransferase involved in cell wall biosynthesis
MAECASAGSRPVTPPGNHFPGVSVIVAVRNGEAYLSEALASIRLQTLPPAEILVVDGDSSDGSVAVAESFAGVRVVKQQGKGLAGARNQGLALASQPYVAFLDHDDRWLPDKLALQVGLLEREPEIAYCLCQLRFLSPQGEPIVPPVNRAGAARSFPAVTPGGLVARRALFEQTGGFDPAYRIGCDAAWFTSARDAGISWRLVKEELLEKRLHDANLSNQSRINRQEMFRIAAASVARRRLGSPSAPPVHGGG